MINLRGDKKLNKNGQAALELALLGTLILIGFAVILMYGQNFENQQRLKMEAFRKALQKAYEKNASVTYTVKKDIRPFSLFAGFGQGQPSTVSASASVMWQKGMSGPPNSGKAQVYAFDQINDDLVGGQELADGDRVLRRYPKVTKGFDRRETIVESPVSIYSEERRKDEHYASWVRKQETEEYINNTKASELRDTINVTPHVRYDTSVDEEPWRPNRDDKPLPNYVYEGQRYWHELRWINVEAEPVTSQGAYYNATSPEYGHVKYSNATVDTTIYREKTLSTPN